MEVIYLEQPIRCRRPNNVVDFNAYKNEGILRALPAVREEEPLPELCLDREPPRGMDLPGRVGAWLDAAASLALAAAAVLVVFAVMV